jgi:hypothetical protein
MPINDAAGASNIPQEKRGVPATPHMRIGAAGPNLLCMVQMQNCLRFAQLMISF